MTSNRRMHLLLIVGLLTALWYGNAQPSGAVSVQLLAINDLHGNLEPPTGSDGMVNKVPAGGIEYLATHLRNAVRENPNSLIVGAGDLMGASPILSSLFRDRPTIEALNAMGVAITSIGNHELDHGPEELLKAIRGDGRDSPAALYSYLAGNVVRADSGEPILPVTAVRTIGGVKIGFIGETLEGSGQIISAAATRGLRFLETSRIANEAAARFEREGVHAIVLLIHEGGTQHPAEGPADPNGCANVTGSILPVVAKLSPSIRIVISGHTHQFYNCEINGHVVTSAGAYGRLFTRVNLSIDKATDTILSATARNEVVTRDVPKDPAETAILEKYRPRMAEVAGRKVGTLKGDITRTRNDAGESALGEVIADAQLAAMSAADKGGAVIALMNSGGIRQNLPGGPDPNVPRDVSWGDLFAVQPFGNRLMVITMTGDMLRRLLEQQFPANGTPSFLQISHGFTYKYRANADRGHHITEGSMSLNGKPIAPNDRLRVTASDFLVTGGQGLTVFSEGTDPLTGPLDIEALVDYFATHSPVSAGPQNRIVRGE